MSVYSVYHVLCENFPQKSKCELNNKCVAYTFQQTQLICILHSSVDQGQKYIRGKQTGLKKTDYILSLPEISLCSDKNRQRRCRNEPKCHHVNCLRNAPDIFVQYFTMYFKIASCSPILIGFSKFSYF